MASSREGKVFASWIRYMTGDDVQTVLALKNGQILGRLIASLVEDNVEGLVDGEVSEEVNRANVKACFMRLEDEGLRASTLTCTDDDLLAADFGGEAPQESHVLSLVWDLAEALQLGRLFTGGGGAWKPQLLDWCQSRSEPRGVTVTDFHRSFADGKALSAIVDALIRERSVDGSAAGEELAEAEAQRPEQRIAAALRKAERKLGVPPLLAASDDLGAGIPERGLLLYLAALAQPRQRPEPVAGAAGEERAVQPTLSGIAEGMVGRTGEGSNGGDGRGRDAGEAAAGRVSLKRAMLGGAEPPAERSERGEQEAADLSKVAALLTELRDPIKMVAEVVSTRPEEMSEEDAKATFRGLTERMRNLVEVLPDTLECTQQASQLHDRIQAELAKVRARAEFEEAYMERVAELERQCVAVSAALQQQVGSSIGRLRGPVEALLARIAEREQSLVAQVRQVEADKTAILSQAHRRAAEDLARMRAAEAEAEALLQNKIQSVAWLDTGHKAHNALAAAEAGKVEGKGEFTEAFADFNCTLDLRVQRDMLDATAHVLASADFEESKILARKRLEQHEEEDGGELELGGGSRARDASDMEAARRILRGSEGRQGWFLGPDGQWKRTGDDPTQREGTDDLEKLLAHARTLPPREADSYLSQEVVQALIQRGSKNRHSSHLLEAALVEALRDGADNDGGEGADGQKDLGAEIMARVAQQRGGLGEGVGVGGGRDSGERAPPSWGGLPEQETAQEARYSWGRREEVGAGQTVVALGGWDGTQNLRSVERLVEGGGAWEGVSMLGAPRRGAAAAVVAGRVVVVGGWDGRAYLRSAEAWEGGAGKWRAVAGMQQPRCYAGAAAMEGRLYVAGGYHAQTNLDTAEAWDPATGAWSPLPKMSAARRGLGLAALNGHLYAVGGWDGKHNLATVEAYSEVDVVIAVAAVNGKLLAVGGWDGRNFLASVECYEPVYGTKRNPIGEWRALSSMTVPRSYAAAVPIDKRVVVLGGWDGASAQRLDSAEEYLVEEDRWQLLPNMACPRYGLAAVVL